MSDRPGLSIFDDENGNDDRNEATQVIPVARTNNPEPARSAPATGQAPGFPVVRRGATTRRPSTASGTPWPARRPGLVASLEEARAASRRAREEGLGASRPG